MRASSIAQAPESVHELIGAAPVSHNLVGQRLGRKGRGTRDRILAATERLLADPSNGAISLSAVAREAVLGMTTLYLYFGDLTELLLAVLDPVMASAEDCYVAHLRTRWSEATLAAECARFVEAYHAFWDRNARILHMRNSMADAKDERMIDHRIRVSHPLIDMFVAQMDSDPDAPYTPAGDMATVLLTGIERVVTMTTDVRVSTAPHVPEDLVRNLLRAQARLLELGIVDRRAAAAAGIASGGNA